MACLRVSRGCCLTVIASVIIILQYVGLRLWHRQLMFDMDMRRLLDRTTWDVVTGRIPVDTESTETFESLAARHPELEAGGLWRPTDCRSRHHVALIVPYRQREHHLKLFLNHIHPFLQRHQLDYGIYIVDQALPTRFNRAMLMNIGYAEASKQANYSLKYSTLFGGVTALKTEHFKLVNGFSNIFFGWGGEDDDLWLRVEHRGLNVSRYPNDIARYTMLKHTRDPLNELNPKRKKLLRHSDERIDTDGLNSLQYELLKLEKRPLYTWLYVRIQE
ncbi:hypothetical protein NP493_260g03062 [Ridgeia piscesae]|uniref:Galactosyltransferase N-terminal domain-containing protein n=1 Tax=Ridgeia piscesae TaxID=27915 RepID=A0AAD9NY48_RIDPI|nr:hypothetical protein NP493_260g03062 [Ridgeia piscesae]